MTIATESRGVVEGKEEGREEGREEVILFILGELRRHLDKGRLFRESILLIRIRFHTILILIYVRSSLFVNIFLLSF